LTTKNYWEGEPFGCDGTVEITGGGGAGWTTGARAVVLGMYSGPVWPQPSSPILMRASADRDFTIRITV
jgi:hypothetical protein